MTLKQNNNIETSNISRIGYMYDTAHHKELLTLQIRKILIHH